MTIRKLIHFSLAITILLASISSNAQPENHENRELVERWFEHLAAKDTVALGAMYADSAYIESPNWEGVKKGPAAIREIYSRYFSTSPDLVHRLTNVLINKNAVAIEYTFSGTMTDPEKNSPQYMRGKKYTLKACSRMNIQNGKITAQYYYFDQVAFLKQVGFFEHQ